MVILNPVMDSRTFVVGDVHGCLEELDELLRTAQFRLGVDRLILAGDLLDRGPDSVGVVRRARELAAECVVGNHEDKYLQYRERELMVRSGKRAKNKMELPPEKLAIYKQLNDADWAYLDGLPLMIDLNGVVVVHAGFEPGVSMYRQKSEKIMRLVYVDEHGMMAKHPEDFRKKPEGSRRWAETWADCSVVYGHAVFSLTDPTVDFVRDSRAGTVRVHYGIDTGCYAGGRLTAWVYTPAGPSPYPGSYVGGRPSRVDIVQVQAKRCYASRELAAVD